MALFQIIYMSSMKSEDTESLPSILESCYKNNKANGITGMLLHAEGSILQVLEGEEIELRRTLTRIESDDRHTNMFVLIDKEIESRQFSSWSMGFKSVSKDDFKRFPAALHVFKASENEVAVRAREGEALTILKTFAEGCIGVV